MMEPKRYTKEDVVINMQDLFRHILRRWRSIVAGVAVFTLLAVGYKYWQEYRAYRHPPTVPMQEATALSEREKASVNAVLDCQRAYEAQVAHNADAPIMHINPSKVCVTVFSAVIDGENRYGASLLYSQMLKTDAVSQEMAKILQCRETSYAEDLVETEILTDNRAEGGDDSVVLQVRAYAPAEEQSRAMGKALLARLPAMSAAVRQTAGNHTLRATAADFRVEVNDRFRDIQQGYINDAKALNGNLEEAVSGLSDAGKDYIRDLQAGMQNPSSGKPALSPPSLSPKYAVLGFGGGLALLVGLYTFTYLINKRVKSAADLSARYALPVFGVLPQEGSPEKGGAFGRRLKALLYGREQNLPPRQREEWILRQMLLVARRQGVGSVYITGSALTKAEWERLAHRVRAVETEDIVLQVGPCPLQDVAAMEALAAADCLLLVEKAEVSAYATVEQELALGERLGVPPLGAFLLS